MNHSYTVNNALRIGASIWFAITISLLPLQLASSQSEQRTGGSGRWEKLTHQTRQAIRAGDLDTAQSYCLQAQATGETDQQYLCENMRDLAEIQKRKGLIKEAIATLEKCLALKAKAVGDHDVSLEPILLELVELNRKSGKVDALDTLILQVVAIRETALSSENKELQNPLVELMAFYQTQGNYVAELRVLEKFIEIKKRCAEDPIIIANYCLVAAQCALHTNNYSAVEKYCQDALNLYRTKNEASEIGACYSYLATAAFSQKQYAKCVTYCDECRTANARFGDSPLYNKIGPLVLAGRAYNMLKEPTKAVSVLENALQMQSDNANSGKRSRRRIFLELAQAYDAKGDRARASEYERRAKELAQ